MAHNAFFLLDPHGPKEVRKDAKGYPHVVSERMLGILDEAGWYCLKDNVTLCKQGPAGIHQPGATWFETCPICHEKPEAPNSPVQWVESFTWTTNAAELLKDALLQKADAPIIPKPVADEHGHQYTIQEFQDLVAERPLKFHGPPPAKSA